MSKLKLGLQLFSIRDAMAEDMEGTLKAVSEMGYDCVEFAGYFGKTAEEVKAICEKYNLTPISVHQKYDVFIDNYCITVCCSFIRSWNPNFNFDI